jgi:cytochrome c biogenesis protein CcdA
MVVHGLVYTFAVFLTYFIAGLVLLPIISSLGKVSVISYVVIAVLIILAGFVEIKDFFWYGQGFSLQINPNKAKKIHKYVEKITLPGVIFLGAFVAAVELPCTGGPYLAITLVLSQNFNMWALLLLMIYNLIFVMPLIVILLMIGFGTKVQKIKRWKQTGKKWMRLAIGILLILLGWLLILIANNTINLI